MSTTVITLIAIGAFLAGYLLRGCLAVMWERKRRRTEAARRAMPSIKAASPGPLPGPSSGPPMTSLPKIIAERGCGTD